MSIQVNATQDGNQAEITVQGDVTIQSSPALRNAMLPFLNGSGVTSIQVNLAGVEFMDSSGIATLVEGLQWSKKSDGKFVLAGLTATVRDVFELAKLDSVIEIIA
ncbi:MAG: STAS domain-containing protein [Ghiorsea sp.]